VERHILVESIIVEECSAIIILAQQHLQSRKTDRNISSDLGAQLLAAPVKEQTNYIIWARKRALSAATNRVSSISRFVPGQETYRIASRRIAVKHTQAGEPEFG
jgi:hypothetical protein